MASSTSDADTAHKLDVLRRAYRVLKADSEAREQALAEERAAHAATLSEKLALSTKLEAAERELIAANEEVWSASPSPRISTSLSTSTSLPSSCMVLCHHIQANSYDVPIHRLQIALLRGQPPPRPRSETEPRRHVPLREDEPPVHPRGGTARPLWHERLELRLTKPERDVLLGIDVINAKGTSNVKVKNVAAGSLCEAAGLMAGDVVLAVEGTPPSSSTHATQMLKSAPAGVVVISVGRARGGQHAAAAAGEVAEREVAVPLPKDGSGSYNRGKAWADRVLSNVTRAAEKLSTSIDGVRYSTGGGDGSVSGDRDALREPTALMIGLLSELDAMELALVCLDMRYREQHSLAAQRLDETGDALALATQATEARVAAEATTNMAISSAVEQERLASAQRAEQIRLEMLAQVQAQQRNVQLCEERIRLYERQLSEARSAGQDQQPPPPPPAAAQAQTQPLAHNMCLHQPEVATSSGRTGIISYASATAGCDPLPGAACSPGVAAACTGGVGGSAVGAFVTMPSPAVGAFAVMEEAGVGAFAAIDGAAEAGPPTIGEFAAVGAIADAGPPPLGPQGAAGVAAAYGGPGATLAPLGAVSPAFAFASAISGACRSGAGTRDADPPTTQPIPLLQDCSASYVLFLSEMASWRGAPIASRAASFVASFQHTPPPPSTDPSSHPDGVAVRSGLAELMAVAGPIRASRRAFGMASVRAGLERYVMGLLQVRTFDTGADAIEHRVLHAQMETLSFVRAEQIGVEARLCQSVQWQSAQRALRCLAAHSSPFDKMRCAATCCAHLGTLLSQHDGGFIKFAALLVLASRPPQLHSHLEYAARFVHPDKLWDGELGGGLSIMRAAVQWLAIQDAAMLQLP